MSQDANQLYEQGFSLYKEAKLEEAIIYFEKAIELNPSLTNALYCQGNCLYSLQRHEEAIPVFEAIISIDPNFAEAYYCKGICLFILRRVEEALESFSQAISVKPSFDQAVYCKANCLFDLDRKEEALEVYNEAIKLNSNTPLYICRRGQCLLALNRQDEATADFKKSYSLLQSGVPDPNLDQANLEFVRNSLKSVLEMEEMASKTEDVAKELNQDNSEVKTFISRLKALQQKKNVATLALLKNVDKNSSGSEAQTIRDEYMKEFEKLKKEMEEVKGRVNKIDQDIAEIKTEMKDIKAELASKMDDYHKKLDNELIKNNISAEDQAKIKDYFIGFIQTFSSIFVTSQVIDSGQVEISVGNNSSDLVSVVASFIPFVGNIVSSGITSIRDFLNSKEMKINARKVKGLAADSTALSQVIGKSAFEIVTTPSQQEKIISLANESLQEDSSNLFQKVAEFCDKIDQGLDVYIYSQFYQTPQSRLGHMDANNLVQLWIQNKIPPYDVSARFVQIIIQGQDEKEVVLEGGPSEEAPKEIPSASFKCGECSIF